MVEPEEIKTIEIIKPQIEIMKPQKSLPAPKAKKAKE